MLALARRFRAITYSRYLAASVVALALDLGLFMLLRAAGLPIVAVSALSYSAGIAAHWLLSSRLVFSAELHAPGAGRTRQQLLFVLSALIGLSMTVVIVSTASLFIDARLAKLLAVGVSFQVTYLLRSRIVFA